MNTSVIALIQCGIGHSILCHQMSHCVFLASLSPNLFDGYYRHALCSLSPFQTFMQTNRYVTLAHCGLHFNLAPAHAKVPC